MATGKKSFVLYSDLIHVVRKLPREIRGDLFLIILEYVNDHLDIVQAMEEVDILLSVTFEPVKQQLKRDLKKYEQKQVQRSEAGKRSAELRAVKQTEQTSTVVESRSTNSTVNVNVNDNGNVLSKDNINTPIPPKEKTWKTDFEIYKSELFDVYNSLLFDSEFISTQERLNPNVNIQLTLEKSVLNFWATEAGWKNKKKSRSKEIDWKATLVNAISQPMNKVYKQNGKNIGNNKNRPDLTEAMQGSIARAGY